MKEPILWNRLGSAADIAASIIGANGSINGSPTYEAVKFGNGVHCNAATEFIDFISGMSKERGCIEFWWKPAVASSSTTTRHFVSGSNSLGAYRFQTNGANAISGLDSTNGVIATLSGLSWAANDLVFCALVWDDSGIDGGTNSLRVYVETPTQVLQYASSDNLPIWDGDFDDVVRVGNLWTPQAVDNGTVDNLKVYDYAKVDFSDRFSERGGLNDQSILI